MATVVWACSMHQCVQRPCECCKHSAESRACISRILLLPLCICSNRKAEKFARNVHPVPSCAQQTRRLFFFSFNTRGPLAMQITYSSYISASGVFTPDTTTKRRTPSSHMRIYGGILPMELFELPNVEKPFVFLRELCEPPPAAPFTPCQSFESLFKGD